MRYAIAYQGEAWQDGLFQYRRGRSTLGDDVCVKIAIGGGDAENKLLQEIRIGERLLNSFSSVYPGAQLTRLIGYSTSPANGGYPFLVTTMAGDPLDRVLDGTPFPPESRKGAIDSLLRGLRYLDSAKVVCRAIRPASLAWNGEALQIFDLRWAAFAGTPRLPRVDHGVWSSPEQRKGDGTTDCRDDVFGAGQVIFHLVTGEDVGEAADMHKRLSRQNVELLALLEGAFVDTASGRPRATELLARRGLPDPCVGSANGARSEREQQARDRYQRLRDEQWEFLKQLDDERRAEADARRRARDAAIARRQAELAAQESARRQAERIQRLIRYGKGAGVAVVALALLLIALATGVF